MRVGVWYYYSVDRPPVKFHRIWSSFDAPTINYSGSIAGVSSDVFGLGNSRRASPLLSSQTFATLPLTARPYLTSLVSPRPSSEIPKNSEII